MPPPTSHGHLHDEDDGGAGTGAMNGGVGRIGSEIVIGAGAVWIWVVWIGVAIDAFSSNT